LFNGLLRKRVCDLENWGLLWISMAGNRNFSTKFNNSFHMALRKAVLLLV
jgi:hypothetical protein